MSSKLPETDDLDQRIATAKAKQMAKHKPKPQSSSTVGYGLGMKMVLDLLGGALVGIVFGLAFDRVFGTEPWGLLVLLLMGLAAGLRLMLRTGLDEARRNEKLMNESSGKSEL